MPAQRENYGTTLIHHTTIYKVFAKRADDGSLDRAFIASVRHLAEQVSTHTSPRHFTKLFHQRKLVDWSSGSSGITPNTEAG